ncbi:MAG: hypothetical protein PHG47_03445, partial [Sulfuricella sp.]|nr:hypothetical protein [Sulfuricella sp.]
DASMIKRFDFLGSFMRKLLRIPLYPVLLINNQPSTPKTRVTTTGEVMLIRKLALKSLLTSSQSFFLYLFVALAANKKAPIMKPLAPSSISFFLMIDAEPH